MAAPLTELKVVIGADISKFQAQMKRLGGQLKRVGTQMKATGRTITRSLTLPLLAAGVAMAKLATDFDTSLVKIETLVGESREQVSAWRDDILALAPAVAVGPKALSDALFVVTSAGASASDALDIVERSAKASAIGLGDTMTVARAVTAAMAAYASTNLTAAESVEILAATVRAGNLEAESIAPVLGRVIGVASKMGVSFAEVGAFIATYTRLGISAEEATTALLGTLNSFLAPAGDATITAARLGTSFDILRKSLREKGLQATLKELNEITGGNAVTLQKLIPNVRALAGVMGTAGTQGEAYGTVLKQIASSTTLVDDGFKRVSETAGFKFRQALIRLQVVGAEIGDTLLPPLVELAERFGKLISRISALSPETIRFSLALAGLVAVVGPILFVLGGMASALGAVFALFGKILAIMNPWVLAIVGATIVASLMWKNWDQVAASLKSVFDAVKDKFSPAIALIKSIVIGLGDLGVRIYGSLLTWWDDNKGAVIAVITGMFSAIATSVSAGFTVVLGVTDFGIRLLNALWEDHAKVVEGFYDLLFPAVASIATSGMTLVGAALVAGVLVANGNYGAALALMQGITQTELDQAGGVFTDFIDGVDVLLGGEDGEGALSGDPMDAEGFKTDSAGFLATLLAKFKSLGDGIFDFGKGAKSDLKDAKDVILDTIVSDAVVDGLFKVNGLFFGMSLAIGSIPKPTDEARTSLEELFDSIPTELEPIEIPPLDPVAVDKWFAFFNTLRTLIGGAGDVAFELKTHIENINEALEVIGINSEFTNRITALAIDIFAVVRGFESLVEIMDIAFWKRVADVFIDFGKAIFKAVGFLWNLVTAQKAANATQFSGGITGVSGVPVGAATGTGAAGVGAGVLLGPIGAAAIVAFGIKEMIGFGREHTEAEIQAIKDAIKATGGGFVDISGLGNTGLNFDFARTGFDFGEPAPGVNGRAQNITINLDGRVIARATMPFMVDELVIQGTNF